MKNHSEKKQFYFSLAVIFPLILVYWFGLPIAFGYDSQDERCLPDVRMVFMVKHHFDKYSAGEMIFFKPQKKVLPMVQQEYIVKVVAGVPGDLLIIKNENVYINNKLVVHGLPLSRDYYGRSPEFFERTEIIPQNKLFLVAYHKFSDDSRYWGYLDTSVVDGKAYKVM